MPDPPTARLVFINCPYSDRYLTGLFRAILFCVSDCGFVPRCALERSNSSDVRLTKITELLGMCRLSIHDLSGVGLDPTNGLPHYNVAFELGLFFGAQQLGDPEQRKRTCLILDTEPKRYRDFLSDLGGNDICAHQDRPLRAIQHVREYLADSMPKLPKSHEWIHARYKHFCADLPAMAESFRLCPDSLSYRDFYTLMRDWQSKSPEGFSV